MAKIELKEKHRLGLFWSTTYALATRLLSRLCVTRASAKADKNPAFAPPCLQRTWLLVNGACAIVWKMRAADLAHHMDDMQET